MLLKFGAVLSIICGFSMAIYTWTHLLQRIVVVRSFLRMLKLRKLAVRKLYLSRGGRTLCQGVLEHGLNLHRNIPLSEVCLQPDSSFLLMAISKCFKKIMNMEMMNLNKTSKYHKLVFPQSYFLQKKLTRGYQSNSQQKHPGSIL